MADPVQQHQARRDDRPALDALEISRPDLKTGAELKTADSNPAVDQKPAAPAQTQQPLQSEKVETGFTLKTDSFRVLERKPSEPVSANPRPMRTLVKTPQLQAEHALDFGDLRPPDTELKIARVVEQARETERPAEQTKEASQPGNFSYQLKGARGNTIFDRAAAFIEKLIAKLVHFFIKKLEQSHEDLEEPLAELRMPSIEPEMHPSTSKDKRKREKGRFFRIFSDR